MLAMTVLEWIELIQIIVIILAIIIGGIWSWYQFSIGDLLKPNFTLKVTFVSISTLESAKLLVIKVSIKNIGKITIEHSDSKFRIFPIFHSEIEKPSKESGETVWEIKLPNTSGIEITPFSPVYTTPESWEREKKHPQGEYPFILRPDEEVSVDIPIVINDLSVAAIRINSSFYCTKMSRLIIKRSIVESNGRTISREEKKKAEYGVQSQHVFDLT